MMSPPFERVSVTACLQVFGHKEVMGILPPETAHQQQGSARPWGGSGAARDCVSGRKWL